MTDAMTPRRPLGPDHLSAGDIAAIERRIDDLFATSRRHAEAAREALVEAMELERAVRRLDGVDPRR